MAKEMPDPSWRKARPGSTFYCASCTQAVGQADVLAGPRDPPPRPGAGQAPRGHARSSHPRRRLLTLATSRAKWKRGPKRNLPRLTHPERLPQAGGGGPASGGSRKVSRSGARGERAGPCPPGTRGQVGREGRPEGPRAHSPRGRSCPLFARAPRRAGGRRPARGSQPRARSRETMRVTARRSGARARGAPRVPSPSPCSPSAPFVRPNPSL